MLFLFILALISCSSSSTGLLNSSSIFGQGSERRLIFLSDNHLFDSSIEGADASSKLARRFEEIIFVSSLKIDINGNISGLENKIVKSHSISLEEKTQTFEVVSSNSQDNGGNPFFLQFKVENNETISFKTIEIVNDQEIVRPSLGSLVMVDDIDLNNNIPNLVNASVTLSFVASSGQQNIVHGQEQDNDAFIGLLTNDTSKWQMISSIQYDKLFHNTLISIVDTDNNEHEAAVLSFIRNGKRIDYVHFRFDRTFDRDGNGNFVFDNDGDISTVSYVIESDLVAD